MSSKANNDAPKEQWEIELIKSHYPHDVRHGEGKVFYRVQWRIVPGMDTNWEEEENWVHEDDMSCPSMINAYWSEYDDRSRNAGVVLDTPPASIKRKYKSNKPSLASTKSKKKELTSAKKKKGEKTKLVENENINTTSRLIQSRAWLQSDGSASDSSNAEENTDKTSYTPISKSILFGMASPDSDASRGKGSLLGEEAEALRQQQQKNEELRRQIAELRKKSMEDVQLSLQNKANGDVKELDKTLPKEVKKNVRAFRKTSLRREVLVKTPHPQKRSRTSDDESPLDESLKAIRAIKEDSSPVSPSTNFSKLTLGGGTPASIKKGPPRAKQNKPTVTPQTDKIRKVFKENNSIMTDIGDEEGDFELWKAAGGAEEPQIEMSTEELVKSLKDGQLDNIADLLKGFANECWDRKLDAINTLKPVYVLLFLPSLDGEPQQDWAVTIFENVPGQRVNHVCQCVPTEQLYSKYPEVVTEAEQRFYTE